MSNCFIMEIDGRRVKTLRDIVPSSGPIRMLIVGKRPSPDSVEKCHYLQGRQGQGFWRRLREYGLFSTSEEYEDDALISHGYGITDIVKSPGYYRDEPKPAEYKRGFEHVQSYIARLQPSVVLFLYKGALDALLRNAILWTGDTSYGFNEALEPIFGSKVFAFPMGGVNGCTKEVISSALYQLAKELQPKSSFSDDSADENTTPKSSGIERSLAEVESSL